MRRSSGILCTLLVAVPVTVSAYFLRPADLISTLAWKGQPMNFAYSLQAHAQKTEYFGTFFASFKGSVEGKTIDKLKLALRITADASGIGGSDSVHASAQMRIVNRTIYFTLDGLNGSYEPAQLKSVMHTYGGKWYSMPLQELTAKSQQYTTVTSDQTKEIAGEIVNALFALTRTDAPGGSMYSLTLRPDAAEAVALAVQHLSTKYPQSMGSATTTNPTQDEKQQLAEFLSHVNFHSKILTDAQDVLRSLKSYVSVIVDQDGIKGDGVFTGELKMRSAPVSIAIPAGVIDLSSAMEQSSASGTSSSACVPTGNPRAPCVVRPARRG